MYVMELKEDTDCSYNDDEVFFGRLTLKEVKKRIFMDVRQKNISKLDSCDKQLGDDFKLIQRSSQTNIVLPVGNDVELGVEHFKSTSDPVFNRNKQQMELKLSSNTDYENQDSFIEIEKNVTEHCNNYLDNTLEFMDFILNHAQSHVKEENVQVTNITKQENYGNDNCYFKRDEANNDDIFPRSIHKVGELYNEHDNEEKSVYIPTTPIKCDPTESISISNNCIPAVTSICNTPIINKKEVSNCFKTPKIPHSAKKDTCAKKTPSRIKAYEHIASPIATYIRNSPQVPLVKDVHPKKPLPSMSLIPKLLKNVPDNKSDKENVVLPQIAYRNAKKTLVIEVNKEKLPQSDWAQKLTGLPQKPVVLKHNHREAHNKHSSLQQEDSFQDLSLHQADVSVCTQKLAFQKL